MARKLGELPTMKFNQEQVAEFAKHADARAREGLRVSEPEIEVSVEYLDEVPTALRRSDVMPIVRSVDGPSLEAVPVIVVAKDDLAWFEFEADGTHHPACHDRRRTPRWPEIVIVGRCGPSDRAHRAPSRPRTPTRDRSLGG